MFAQPFIAQLGKGHVDGKCPRAKVFQDSEGLMRPQAFTPWQKTRSLYSISLVEPEMEL